MMSYVALLVPFVLAYIAWVWRQMAVRRLTADEVAGDSKSC
jgi:cytochrome d ubiquinol oxidase subunit II